MEGESGIIKPQKIPHRHRAESRVARRRVDACARAMADRIAVTIDKVPVQIRTLLRRFLQHCEVPRWGLSAAFPRGDRSVDRHFLIHVKIGALPSERDHDPRVVRSGTVQHTRHHFGRILRDDQLARPRQHGTGWFLPGGRGRDNQDGDRQRVPEDSSHKRKIGFPSPFSNPFASVA